MQPHEGSVIHISDLRAAGPGRGGPPPVIGLFDSGVGGLTVAGEVFRQLPDAPVVYFGDTAHVPYGGRTTGELTRFAEQIIAFLVEQGVGYLIFACNTSSAVSLDQMRGRFSLPMVGLIGPGARAAADATGNGRVGVIATGATVASGAYERAIRARDPQVRVFSRPAPRLVPLIEAGRTEGVETEAALREYLAPLQAEGVDTLVMGCTHYPFLAPVIARIMGPGVALVDPARATVHTARRRLAQLGYRPDPQPAVPPRHRYFVSADAPGFARAARRFLNPGAPLAVHQVRLDE